MAGDHQVLVGFYHIRADTARRCGDARLMLAVRRLVELEPQPAASPADGAAHRWGVLTHPCGEDDPIEAAERRRERGDVRGGAIAKPLDAKSRAGLSACQKLTEIRRSPG